jgi:hypothetical protein
MLGSGTAEWGMGETSESGVTEGIRTPDLQGHNLAL